MDEMGARIDSNWAKVETMLDGTTTRMGQHQSHVTLNKIKELVEKAMRELKKEADQFKQIQDVYNAADIPCKHSM